MRTPGGGIRNSIFRSNERIVALVRDEKNQRLGLYVVNSFGNEPSRKSKTSILEISISALGSVPNTRLVERSSIGSVLAPSQRKSCIRMRKMTDPKLGEDAN